MKTVLQVLNEEKEELQRLIETGNYDMLKDLLEKTENKIKEIEEAFESSRRLDKAIEAVNKSTTELKRIDEKIKQNRNNQPWNPINLPPQENPKEDWKGNKWTGD